MDRAFHPDHISIEEWTSAHPLWDKLIEAVNEQGQHDWVTFTADWHHSSHLLVAVRGQEILGFLRFVVQEIGPDSDCPPVQFNGENLLEAKVLAFAVKHPYRRRGIGRALQEHLIEVARALGLFQIRSHSGGDNIANHQLKLALGYGVHPIIRNGDNKGAYFILPLHASLTMNE
jgi:GNAT superfamily N-acetyltransferase